MRLEVALLSRRQIVVEDDQARLALGNQRLEFIRLASAHEITRRRLFAARLERADNTCTSCPGELCELIEMIGAKAAFRVDRCRTTAKLHVHEDGVIVGFGTIEEHQCAPRMSVFSLPLPRRPSSADGRSWTAPQSRWRACRPSD